MLEVEIRGKLSEKEFRTLKRRLAKEGKHVESHTREMIRLYDYPGFAEDTLKREVDIRLRDTDGDCEIMVKRKAAENNLARHELSLKLRDKNLENAKQIVKALGYSRGLWMHRKKDVYKLRGVEWSVVEAPKKYFYYEAEKMASDKDIRVAEKKLNDEASRMGLTVFSPEEYLKFIQELSQAVNKRIEW